MQCMFEPLVTKQLFLVRRDKCVAWTCYICGGCLQTSGIFPRKNLETNDSVTLKTYKHFCVLVFVSFSFLLNA